MSRRQFLDDLRHPAVRALLQPLAQADDRHSGPEVRHELLQHPAEHMRRHRHRHDPRTRHGGGQVGVGLQRRGQGEPRQVLLVGGTGVDLAGNLGTPAPDPGRRVGRDERRHRGSPRAGTHHRHALHRRDSTALACRRRNHPAGGTQEITPAARSAPGSAPPSPAMISSVSRPGSGAWGCHAAGVPENRTGGRLWRNRPAAGWTLSQKKSRWDSCGCPGRSGTATAGLCGTSWASRRAHASATSKAAKRARISRQTCRAGPRF